MFYPNGSTYRHKSYFLIADNYYRQLYHHVLPADLLLPTKPTGANGHESRNLPYEYRETAGNHYTEYTSKTLKMGKEIFQKKWFFLYVKATILLMEDGFSLQARFGWGIAVRR